MLHGDTGTQQILWILWPSMRSCLWLLNSEKCRVSSRELAGIRGQQDGSVLVN